MERSPSTLDLETESHTPSEAHESSRCNTCGEEFEVPLFAVISSGYPMEKYYACPRCLSKVGGVEISKTVEVDKAEEGNKRIQELEVEDKTEEKVACAHNLGYLKQRPKDKPIPEECLTCEKILDCMSY